MLHEADIIVTGAGYEEYLPQFSAKKCLLFHGTLGLLSEGLIKRLMHFDHLFLIGQRMEQQLLRCNDKYNIPYSVTGFLPFALFPKKNVGTRREILQKLGLNTEKKTIVYTPSKARVGTWLHCAEDIARETPTDFNLVMRPHPNQALNGNREDKASFNRVLDILKDRPDCIVDLTTCSLPELECVADLMITDANSPAEESMFYDCAQLFADANQSGRKAFRRRFESVKMHAEDTEEYLQLFDCGPNYYADQFTNWGVAIQTALESKDQYAAARQKTFQYIFGEKDRLAVDRVKKALKLFI